MTPKDKITEKNDNIECGKLDMENFDTSVGFASETTEQEVSKIERSIVNH